jgi:predicted DNA-binding transcriptional regulator YafY
MRASRLLSILLLLQLRGRMTARELAVEAGVSLRTVYRDVEALSAAGVPVYGEPGPAGGYALVDGYRTRLTGLTADEAGVLFLAGMPGPAAELGLGALLASAELKVLAALPPGLRESAAQARERFLLDAPGWFRENDRPPHLATVAAAVWEQQPLRVRYRGRDGAGERIIDPLGLVLKAGAWYLVARAGGGLRTYRVSRVEALEVLEGGFQRPEDFDLTNYWRESSEGFLAQMYGDRATVRLSPRGLRHISHFLDDPWVVRTAITSAAPPDQDCWTQVLVPIESVEIAVAQLLPFGPEAEVLAPAELRQRLAEVARKMARLYDEMRPDADSYA